MIAHARIETTEHPLHLLNNDELVMDLKLAVRGEGRFTIRVLQDLNEMHRRRLHLDLGYSSLYDYCVRCLKYSSSQAGRYIQTARCIRHFPEVLELLRMRELCMSTIALIEPILTEENKDSILSRVRGASYRDVQRVVSEYRPPVAYRDRIVPVRVVLHDTPAVDQVFFDRECAQQTPDYTPPLSPVWGDRLLTQFLADEELIALFAEVKSLLPGKSSFADVMRVVFSEYRDRHSPSKRHARRLAKNGPAYPDSLRRECDSPSHTTEPGNASAPDPERAKPASSSDEIGLEHPDSRRRECTRHIPDEVRDEIFVRDRGLCTFTSADGTRCGSKTDLQIDHVRPFAAGGEHDSANLRLLSAGHNRRAAEKVFGTAQELYRRE